MDFTGNLILYLITHFGIPGIIIVPIIALNEGFSEALRIYWPIQELSVQ
ncbi:MAG: hypothetical protein RE471_05230 [Ferroplasma sp.]|nr:hypothetical protein [Ferroplasma sp.]WMT50387.1 MAG: hypothetical protein RE471_05230 [Ferroplasma sp.]